MTRIKLFRRQIFLGNDKDTETEPRENTQNTNPKTKQLALLKIKQEQSETAYVRQGECGLDPDSGCGSDSGSGLLPKFIRDFLV